MTIGDKIEYQGEPCVVTGEFVHPELGRFLYLDGGYVPIHEDRIRGNLDPD